MFKKFIAVALLALGFASIAQAQVSVSVGGPIGRGGYGAISIGDDRPDLVYEQPRVVSRVGYVDDPVYLYVPEDEYNNWPVYCRNYGYCNYPVFFVQDYWYRNHYPRYRTEYRRPFVDDRFRGGYRGDYRGGDRFHGGDFHGGDHRGDFHGERHDGGEHGRR